MKPTKICQAQICLFNL